MLIPCLTTNNSYLLGQPDCWSQQWLPDIQGSGAAFLGTSNTLLTDLREECCSIYNDSREVVMVVHEIKVFSQIR